MRRRRPVLLARRALRAVKPPSRLVFALGSALLVFVLGWMSASLLRIDAARRAETRSCERGRTLDAAVRAVDARLCGWLAEENLAALPAPSPDDPVAGGTGAGTDSAFDFVHLRFQVTPEGELRPFSGRAGGAAAAFARLRERLGDGDVFRQGANLREVFYDARSAGKRRIASVAGGPLQRGGAASAAVSPLYPVWLGGELFLLRSVDTKRGDSIQGLWVDWPRLRDDLAAGLSPILKRAVLKPVSAAAPARPSHANAVRLNTLPVLVEDGLFAPGAGPLVTPIRLVIAVCWLFALFALAGCGVMYFGAVALAERRATFASAVSHELRTPLTSMLLYSESLASDPLPPDEARRKAGVIHAETIRLAHLVENILSYARVTRGRGPALEDSLTVDELFSRVAPRLIERIEGAGMEFKMGYAENDAGTGDDLLDAGEALLRTNATAVEQILFNLADNAAKYAGAGRHASLIARATRGAVEFVFGDDGPGVPGASRRRLFAPFHRSAEAAAGRKPGVGLGLAISRQLARRLGGDLVHLRDRPGCVFRLVLPRE